MTWKCSILVFDKASFIWMTYSKGPSLYPWCLDPPARSPHSDTTLLMFFPSHENSNNLSREHSLGFIIDFITKWYVPHEQRLFCNPKNNWATSDHLWHLQCMFCIRLVRAWVVGIGTVHLIFHTERGICAVLQYLKAEFC